MTSPHDGDERHDDPPDWLDLAIVVHVHAHNPLSTAAAHRCWKVDQSGHYIL